MKGGSTNGGIVPRTPTTRSNTLPIPTSQHQPQSALSSSRPSSGRSRTSTVSFAPPLPPVMSRENSFEGIVSEPEQLSKSLEWNGAGPSRSNIQSHSSAGRKASKSVSNARPPISTSKRPQSYHHSHAAGAGAGAAPAGILRASPTPESNPRAGLKRRTSTPHLHRRPYDDDSDVDGSVTLPPTVEENKGKKVESRARSTSTSLVVPETLQVQPHQHYLAAPGPPYAPSPLTISTTPASQWTQGIYVTPASPEREEPPSKPKGFLNSVYNAGESSVRKLVSLVKPSSRSGRRSPRRRASDEDFEKGFDGSEEDGTNESAESSQPRMSEDSLRRGGKHWAMWSASGSTSDEDGGYFSLPPTPPEEKVDTGSGSGDFESALRAANLHSATLPTPALSATSLSRNTSKKRKLRVSTGTGSDSDTRDGWWKSVLVKVWSSSGNGKTGEVLRELGWTVGILGLMFFITGGLAIWMIKGMPITQLKHIPSSTTDLQLLSAEIRSYMASSEAGWWHTVGVLTFVGCWKHAWSVPGAVVLNILVGSVFDPMPALFLLTLITASGSLFSYMLSRPLAPLIAVLFPKPLALVRAALAPESVPTRPDAHQVIGEKITPIQASSSPSSPPIGNDSKPTIWRRLLIMRAMGFVPWSGMNVACGVVGVDWKTFWLTTAAGSASWSYVTASVGNILSRLAIPQSALSSSVPSDEIQGESLTSLLRDPILITKLVFLTALTVLPVIIKRRTKTDPTEEEPKPIGVGIGVHPGVSSLRAELSSPPSSPLTQSLARFTPTPQVFDLLSFGRTAVRTGANVVMTGVKSAGDVVGRVTNLGRA